MPKLDITSQERSALRAAAHPLRPVVLVGDRGLSESVLKEIDLNLNAHQLIKVRISGQERAERDAMLETICESLSCAPVHHLGKTLVLYRPDAAKAQAEAEARNSTRAQRKPAEPYTPKKQAATGLTQTRKGQAAQRAGRKAQSPETAAPRARRPAAAPAPHRIPRRAGSALTLRAGVRRSPPAGARKR